MKLNYLGKERKEVVVVIPVYKKEINPFEMISLKRGVSILSEHDLVLIAPENLDLEVYYQVYDKFRVERFKSKYFDGIAGYNKLMMSYSFYGRFRSYKYLLIYQLDAYVFRDDLLHWCQKGYDYIGAPWLIEPPRVKEHHIIELGKYLVNKVGNGGFSLRKIETHFRLCILLWPLIKIFIKHEDFFWCVFVKKIYPFYNVPEVEEAVGFAIEHEPRRAFEMNNNQLPFGCHAWEKYDYTFWKDYIN